MNGKVHYFSEAFDIIDIVNIRKYFNKKQDVA